MTVQNCMVKTSSSSSLKTTSSLKLDYLWEMRRQQVLWDGIFQSHAWQPRDISCRDSCVAALPSSRHQDPPAPAWPAQRGDTASPAARLVTLPDQRQSQPCCLSSDIPCLVTFPAWEGGLWAPPRSHAAHGAWAATGALTALRQMKENQMVMENCWSEPRCKTSCCVTASKLSNNRERIPAQPDRTAQSQGMLTA